MFEQIGTVLARTLSNQRARVPVRGGSYERGRREGAFWRKTSRQEVRLILFAAKRYELNMRRKGRRSGPLGSVAIEVLEYLANLVDFRTGRLEPSLDTLMRRLKRSRDAIVRALRNLRTHGFLDWLRRYTPTGHEGRGPQLRQVSNAYRLHLPERAKQFLGRWGCSQPLPEDCEHALEVRAAELEQHDKSPFHEGPDLSGIEDDELRQSLTLLGNNIKRKSARRAEPENAYRLSLPERAKQFLGRWGRPQPLPEDCEHALEVRKAELDQYRKSLSCEDPALSGIEDDGLRQSLALLGKNVKRESARRAESESESIKPEPD